MRTADSQAPALMRYRVIGLQTCLEVLGRPLERNIGKIAAAVNDANDLDFVDQAIIGVGIDLIKNEVWLFEQNARSISEMRPPRPQAWMIDQQSNFVFYGG